ncbi:MAG: hypothetical protein ACXQT3_03675 [Methermicoccaceae archaeon]
MVRSRLTILAVVLVLVFMLGGTAAAQYMWETSINATGELEGVVVGTASGATDGYDMGIDEPTNPPAPTFTGVVMALDTAWRKSIKPPIGEDETRTWTLTVSVGSESTVLTWNPSPAPAIRLHISENGTELASGTTLDKGTHKLFVVASHESTPTPPAGEHKTQQSPEEHVEKPSTTQTLPTGSRTGGAGRVPIEVSGFEVPSLVIAFSLLLLSGKIRR